MRISDWSSDGCSSDLFGSEDGPVDTRFGATFLLSGLVVELVARVWGTDDRARFALLSGLGIGTVGLAGEYLWNADAWQPWTTNLFPEVIGFGIVGGVGAAVLGAAFARAIERDATVRPLSALLVAGAAIACLAVVLLPMRRSEEHTSELQSLMRNSYAVY